MVTVSEGMAERQRLMCEHTGNRTKIVATLGPATANPEALSGVIQAGASVIRVNMSHGAPADHERNIKLVRDVSKKLCKSIAVLADLQGPKFRTGPLENDEPLDLVDGESVCLTSAGRFSGKGVIGTKYRALVDGLEPGMRVLIDDGKIRLKVEKRLDAETVECRIVQGGQLNARKGINIPDKTIDVDPLTAKDKEDALCAVRAGADYLALSFVQRGRDIEELRNFIRSNNLEPPPIIAKIEKPQALDDIDRILETADAVMVARGDLGVELPPEQVPVVQKQLVELANVYEKPVIIATQMLESMIDSVTPSRSDTSDIANAVFDRADALMLSGETAVGRHPVEAVDMMRRIIEQAENSYLSRQYRPHESSSLVSPNFYHAIAHSASYAAAKADVKAIVVFSNSGSMARRVSKLKPQRPIIALTPHEGVCRRMSLLWGVNSLVVAMGNSSDEVLEEGERAILESCLLAQGDSVVFCAGQTPLKGATNMLKIYRIGETENQG